MPAATTPYPARRLRGLAGGLLPIAAVLLAAAVLVPALLGLQRYVITSGSMTGTYERGSLVYDRVVPTATLGAGAVIASGPPAGDAPRRRRHPLRPAVRRRAGRPRHAPDRLDRPRARWAARLAHEGRRE